MTSIPAEQHRVTISDAPLHLALDARKLFDGGIGTYIRNLIQGLIELRKDEGCPLELSLFLSPEVFRSKEWQQCKLYHEVRSIILPCKPYSLSEYLLFAKRVSWKGIDIFHSPHFTLPYGIPVPGVVTVHDVIHLSHPQRWYYPLMARPMIGSALKRAHEIITVSETSKAAVRSYFPRTKDLSVIPNAVDSFFASDDVVPIASDEPYILVVASTDKPHKGVDDVIDAYAQFASHQISKNEMLPSLFLCGKGGARLRPYEGPGRVSFLGIQSAESLRDLFRGAELLCVPSLVEGSCMPALEAHACGVPVVARPVPAVIELLDETVDTVAKDFSPEALSEALIRAYQKEPRSHHDVLREKTLQQHSVREIARQTLSVYERALGRGQ